MFLIAIGKNNKKFARERQDDEQKALNGHP
jgi:hypothetical protein